MHAQRCSYTCAACTEAFRSRVKQKGTPAGIEANPKDAADLNLKGSSVPKHSKGSFRSWRTALYGSQHVSGGRNYMHDRHARVESAQNVEELWSDMGYALDLEPMASAMGSGPRLWLNNAR